MHKMSDSLLEIHLPKQVNSLISHQSKLIDQILNLNFTNFPLTILEIHLTHFFEKQLTTHY